jgi:hypothetical protein
MRNTSPSSMLRIAALMDAPLGVAWGPPSNNFLLDSFQNLARNWSI